jgi:hypothetical protein
MGPVRAGQDRKDFLRDLKRTVRERFDKHGRIGE